MKYQSFVINIIYLFGELYLISINLFLIFISKLVLLTPETATTIVKKSMKGPVKIFFGQSKIHVRY